MPTGNSARKRQRQAEKRSEDNGAARRRLTTARTRLKDAVAAGDRAAAEAALRRYASYLDRAARRGAVKAGLAARRKARAARWVNGLAPASTSTP
ncbi:MAG: 30S ribosomal protein S20 [Lentisphaerae bacterium]|nr:30S ribosomal protein S20 [Lentisphaerota bacterium]